MRVCVTLEERFLRTPDGHIWSGTGGTAGYAFWTRYLDVFDQVRVIARVADAAAPDPRWTRADGVAVIFHAVPHYIGPVQYARRAYSIRKAVRSGVTRDDALIMRVPSPIGACLGRQLDRTRPFGIELLGDVYDVFAPGAIRHPLRPFLRARFTSEVARLCRKASAVAYVSRETLQRRYPARERAYATAYSSVNLDDAAFVVASRSLRESGRPLRLISIGTLDVPYKGFDTLVQAADLCSKAGLDFQLSIVGDGRCRKDLEQDVRLRGLERRVTFMGRLYSAPAVRNELDQADIFVLASKTEGLPRAMIEAMARALPCLGTAVGAIPELLGEDELVERGDATRLAQKIIELGKNAGRMNELSAENLAKARDYHALVLSKRRRDFYSFMREATREWSEMRFKSSQR